MLGVHHSAICTSDVERSLRFWRDGLGMSQLMDYHFTGDWPELFGAKTDRLRSIFLGDPQTPGSGIVELVELAGSEAALPGSGGPRHGFFLLSLQREVDETLVRLGGIGIHRGCSPHRCRGPGRKDRRHGGDQRTGRRTRRIDRAGEMSVALVTGGASGIGHEVAGRLRDAGHDVVVWDLSEADIACDISDPDAVSAAMERTVREHGVPTRVVTCAAIGAAGVLLKQSPAEWERVLAVNLTGTWLTIRAAARAMIDAGAGGSIVAVSSISGSIADRDMGAYCVSKAGVDMLVKVAAVEWGTHDIRVNAVGPGVTRTPMLANPEALPGWVEGMSERTALGGLGQAADVAGAIVGVLELPWVTGQIVHADGGLALHSPIDAYGQVQRLMAQQRSAKGGQA